MVQKERDCKAQIGAPYTTYLLNNTARVTKQIQHWPSTSWTMYCPRLGWENAPTDLFIDTCVCQTLFPRVPLHELSRPSECPNLLQEAIALFKSPSLYSVHPMLVWPIFICAVYAIDDADRVFFLDKFDALQTHCHIHLAARALKRCRNIVESVWKQRDIHRQLGCEDEWMKVVQPMIHGLSFWWYTLSRKRATNVLDQLHPSFDQQARTEIDFQKSIHSNSLPGSLYSLEDSMRKTCFTWYTIPCALRSAMDIEKHINLFCDRGLPGAPVGFCMVN